jgi:transcriptional regulator with XRE-family HTH domain
MLIGKTLREIRSVKGLSLSQLADKSGTTKSYLSKIENEKREATISTIRSVCKALGVPLNIFILLSEDIEQDEFFELNSMLKNLARKYVISD